MANAYHMDALRKQRVLDRKNEALRRMMNAGSEDYVPEYIVERAQQQSTSDGLVTTDMGQYNQVRPDSNILGITHDTNFKYRALKGSGTEPIHVDTIYKIIYPAAYTTVKGKYPNKALFTNEPRSKPARR